jgi:hypothetical protein
VEIALKSGFLKTDADLQLEAGMAECLKIRKEVARRYEFRLRVMVYDMRSDDSMESALDDARVHACV